MSKRITDLKDLVCAVLAAKTSHKRRLIALAGPPASGKSTLAKHLAETVQAKGVNTQIVPMDGFHLDNQVLDQRGLRCRKGAPDTFDASEFLTLVQRLAKADNVPFPTFDRAQDKTIPDSGLVRSDCELVIVEGNYLMFDAPVWRDLGPLWDLSIRLEVEQDVIKTRLIDRWTCHGLDHEQALARAEANDLPNARAILDAEIPTDVIFGNV